jgi:hypothetical protein
MLHFLTTDFKIFRRRAEKERQISKYFVKGSFIYYFFFEKVITAVFGPRTF